MAKHAAPNVIICMVRAHMCTKFSVNKVRIMEVKFRAIAKFVFGIATLDIAFFLLLMGCPKISNEIDFWYTPNS